MRVIITGGGGFLGSRLVEVYRRKDDAEIIAVDLQEPHLDGCQFVKGDIATDGFDVGLLKEGPCLIYHLASVVSAAAEENWENAVEQNVLGLMNLLKSCRESSFTHRLVFCSSVAVFGGELARSEVGDLTKHAPSSTYGMTKAVGELLVNDATRKGHIDGRTARLPTVIIRPGVANAAASSFASGIFREPLAGKKSVIPVEMSTELVVISPETAVAGLCRLAELPGESLGTDKALNLPGLKVTVREMLSTLESLCGTEVSSLVTQLADSRIEEVVSSWPSLWNDLRSRSLGFDRDESLVTIIETYLEGLSH
ncbi:MAG: NAD-dependent epimerase/dehydratase family protein [Acidimicrobiales bacterium]|nr:NAD-dependent epimerase/dehydratase family protein [Acidimicrobiales bacterium]